MSSNSEKIIFTVRLPNEMFWQFTEVARAMGETKSTIVRTLIRTYIKKPPKKPSVLRK